MLRRRRLRTKDGQEYIIAEEQDFNIALEVATPFLKTTLTGLDKVSLQVLEFMGKKETVDPRYEFTIKEIQAGVRKEDGSSYSERYLREKLDLLEQDNKVSIGKDTKPYKVILLTKEPSSIEELIKIIDHGESILEEYKKEGEIIARVGADISSQTSKSIEEFRGKDIDVVVTVCTSSAKVVCPFCSSPVTGDRPEIIKTTLPRAKHYLQHGFSDPSEVDGSDDEKIAAFRRTRDDIKKWILDYFADLKTEGSDGRA